MMHSIHPRTSSKICKASKNIFIENPLGIPKNFNDFAETCRIRSGTNIVPFKLYDWQQELSQIADNHKGLTAFKTRQLGVTEVFACKMLHKACLSPAYSGAVLSLGGKETSKVAKRVRRMPSAIDGFRFTTNAVTDLQVAGGGMIAFAPSTDNAVRSLESTHDLLFDEAAFVPNEEEIYSGAVPSQEMVGDAARTWVISTMSPEGKMSWFWREMLAKDNHCDVEEIIAKVREGTLPPFYWWVDANGWAKVIIHWRSHPIYSIIPNYLEKTKKEKKLPESKLQREYNLGIPEGGGSLFVASFVDACAIGQWRSPQKSRCYLAGIDPNFGGNDFYVCQIWDVTTTPYSLAAEYRDSQRSNEYNELKSLELLDAYSPSIVAVEKNSGGAIILEQLRKKRPRLRIEPVTTSRTSKIVHTDRLALATEFKQVVYPKDWIGVQEMKRFSLATREASTGNDDSIMAWAAAWVWLDEAITEGNRSSALKSLFK